jgi:hypothetical protein
MTTIKNHNTSICWQTHTLDDHIITEFIRLEKECSSDCDVFMFYDNSRNDFKRPNLLNNSNIWLFNFDDLQNKYNLIKFRKKPLVIGNKIFPLLDFSSKFKYDKYWLIEHDVRFTGKWCDFFDYFKSNRCDLLGTTFYRYSFRKSWKWWRSLKTTKKIKVKRENRVRGFFPILRISKKGLDIVLQGNKTGWQGHHEVSLPTLMDYYGLEYEDVGGDGEFVLPENINRFYLNTPKNKGLGPGTFVCPPTRPLEEVIPNKLYHGIK